MAGVQQRDGERVLTGNVFYSGDPRGHETQLHIRSADGAITQPSPQGDTLPGSRPSASPDGTKIAYVATRTNSTWSVAGDDPRWSPDGDHIAYVQPMTGHVEIVNADGPGAHTSSSGLFARTSLTWSPGGAWILARVAGGLGLIDTATGETLSLNYLARYSNPDWR